MDVSSIGSALTGSAPAAQSGPGKLLDGFGKALTDAVDGLDQLQKEADTQSVALATGQDVDLHEVMLAQSSASLSLNLAVQVRNKLVEAYQDVMRMQL